VHVCVHVHVHVRACAHVYVCVCLCVCEYVCVCAYVCVYYLSIANILFLALNSPCPRLNSFVNQLTTHSAQDYIPTPQDHSLNTYGITPHAAVIQHISTPEDGHVNVRNM